MDGAMQKNSDDAADFKMQLAEKLADYCRRHQLSQRQLADTLGRHTATVNGYLKHPRGMSDEFVRLVAERLPGFGQDYLRYRELLDAPLLPELRRTGAADRRARRRELLAIVEQAQEPISRARTLILEI